ncbi:hypothetical protein [Cupriavidus sp. IDO]|uniref:hypothetical protein n=1 Tax=Cupriavidus sp. IDO TaxID=1539142 RepID=UPI00068A76A0|nr:hypothetical protein [Cupriavidus sp. IDO]KWR89578.1 hypothetical protein RM96_13460 [Cupriavidus sp. IDO]
MLFVADHIPKELKRIVEFLNVQMDPAEVLALEIRQYIGENLKTFVPTIIGQTSEAEVRKSATKKERLWDESSFMVALRDKDPKGEPYARRLLDWASAHSTIWWGRGSLHGSFVPMISSTPKAQALLAMYTFGKVQLYLKPLSAKAPFSDAEKMQQAIELINAALPSPLPSDAAAKTPQVRLADLSEQEFARFLSALEWMVQTIHAA